MKEFMWQKKPWQAFKTFALIFSFLVNFVLIIVLLLMLPQILPLVNGTAKPIVGGLNQSFIEMNQASIISTIEVSDTVPVNLDVQLVTDTVVTITQDILLGNYPITMILPGGAGYINGEVSMVLPTGLALPIELNVDVPVRDEIPVNLLVDVNIPLNKSELGTPFTRLEDLFGPLVDLLDQLPEDNDAAIQLAFPK